MPSSDEQRRGVLHVADTENCFLRHERQEYRSEATACELRKRLPVL